MDCIKCADGGVSGQTSRTESIRKDRGAKESVPKTVVIGSFGLGLSFDRDPIDLSQSFSAFREPKGEIRNSSVD